MRILASILCALAAAVFHPSGQARAQPVAAVSGEVRLSHISVQSLGSGDPVVLIPGLSTPRDVWNGIAPGLARKHRVLLVQVNGFAGDDPGANHGPGVLDGIVRDLHGYIADQKLGRVPVIGHSMGGLVGMMLASEHPAVVSRVMVVDALPFAGTMFDEHATVDAVRPVAAMLKTKLSAGYSGPDGAAAAAANARALTARPESAARVTAWIRRADANVSAQAMVEDLLTDMRPKLASISAPMTIVHPATAFGKDLGATSAFYQDQFTGAKRIEFVTVPDSGHFIMLDQPEAFAGLISAFLRE